MSAVPCPVCHGKRLKKEVLGVTVGGLNIMELTDLSITESLQFFETLSLTEQEQKIATQILKEIKERLGFLKNVGLEYLTLSRTAGSLFRRRKSADSAGNADWLVSDGRSVYFG